MASTKVLFKLYKKTTTKSLVQIIQKDHNQKSCSIIQKDLEKKKKEKEKQYSSYRNTMWPMRCGVGLSFSESSSLLRLIFFY